MNDLTPSYLREPVPDPQIHLFGPRSTNVLPPIPCRNDRFKNSFYPDAVRMWNNVGVEFRSIPKLSDFKSSYLEIISPLKRDIFGIHDPDGVGRLFQLRVGLSPLRAHRKRHGFKDADDDTCTCGSGAEDSFHFLLSCPFFSNYRTDFLGGVSRVVDSFPGMSGGEKLSCLLYGLNGLSDALNRDILCGTMKFISDSGRFNRE